MKATRPRIDTLLVERGLVESRAKAQALIMAGKVLVDGKTITKPGLTVAEDARFSLIQAPPFVSRGGVKLDYALKQFNLDITGRVAIDVGASTGGFTDCLLQRGAARVYAIDVGYGQMDYQLRQNPRVINIERTNARYPFTLPEKASLATLDVSFISLEKVIPNIVSCLEIPGDIVALVKPQFEARREEVGKGGVIRQPAVLALVLGRFLTRAIDCGFRLGGLVASPITGASGNQEFLVWLRIGNPPPKT